MFVNKIEIKIFLTFFIIYSFFAQWNDIWDFNSSFSLVKAIVEENRIEIDSYHNTTEVKSYYKGHYYTPIAPGISFLMTWVYAVCKTFITDPSIHQFLMVIFSNSLCGALSCLLVYKILNFFTKNKMYRLLTTLGYGACTSSFPYSLGFYVYVPTILFILIVFYLLLKEKTKHKKSLKNFFLAGIFIGFTEVIYPVSIFINFSLFLFFVLICAIDKNIVPFFIFILGMVIGYLPLISFNYTIFNFLVFTPVELNKYWSGKGAGWVPPDVNRFKVLLRVLFYPWNGLFFYYPLLFLSFLGILLMFQKKKIECCIILIAFFLILVWATFLSRWWGDFSFGPRRFLLIIPFLILGLPYVLGRLDLKFFLPFFVLSLFTNLLGLQLWWPSLDNLPRIDEIYVKTVENFQFFRNPLLEDFLPLFIKNGPRSILFENLILKGKIDISRYREYEKDMESYKIKLLSLPFLGTIAIRLPFLCLIPLTIILFFIWNKEIKKILIRKHIKIVVVILVLILLFAFIDIHK